MSLEFEGKLQVARKADNDLRQGAVEVLSKEVKEKDERIGDLESQVEELQKLLRRALEQQTGMAPTAILGPSM
jgi:hypothetical protein